MTENIKEESLPHHTQIETNTGLDEPEGNPGIHYLHRILELQNRFGLHTEDDIAKSMRISIADVKKIQKIVNEKESIK